MLAFVVPGTSSAFTATIPNSASTAASKTTFTCADTFAGDRRRGEASFEFALDEPAGASTAVDSSDSGNSGTYEGSNTKDSGSPIACPNDPGGAYRLDGSTSRITMSTPTGPITGTFSMEVWFKTSVPGKLLGFESRSTGDSERWDKMLYVGDSGKLDYGIYNGTGQVLTTPDRVTDGAWHQVVATTSSDGSSLYVDGRVVATRSDFTTAEGGTGYWRIGQGKTQGWEDNPGDTTFFTGSIRFAAVYSFVLTADEVAASASIGSPGTPAAARRISRRAAPAASPSPSSPSAGAAAPEPSAATPAPSATSTSTDAPPAASTAAPSAPESASTEPSTTAVQSASSDGAVDAGA